MATERRPARFVGVDTYIDPHGRFTFRFPTDWPRYQLDDNLEGVAFSPNTEERPQTWFSAWVRQLEHQAQAEDLKILSKSINEGLLKLDHCQIESTKDDALSNLLKFERIYTFQEGDVVRKRKVWFLYVAQWQIVLTWQGAMPEDYEHWLSMANYSFATFNLPPELWFATDRNLGGAPQPEKPVRVRRGKNKSS